MRELFEYPGSSLGKVGGRDYSQEEVKKSAAARRDVGGRDELPPLLTNGVRGEERFEIKIGKDVEEKFNGEVSD